MNYLNQNRKEYGFTVVEVLVASVIISITTLALISATSKSIELSNRALRQSQASFLMEEGVEAVKSIRDNDWSTIANLNWGDDHYLSFDTNNHTWVLGTTPVDLIDGLFERKVNFSQVYRDDNDNISSSGDLDNGTVAVSVNIDWNTPSGINSKEIDFYLTDIFN